MLTLGVDIGGSNMLATLVDDQGEVCAREIMPTGRDTRPEKVVPHITHLVQRLDRMGLGPAAVGVGFPGLVDHARGWVRSSTILDGWSEVALASLVEAHASRPCTVDNEVNVAAIAEVARRNGGVGDTMLFVAVGTGIGAALCLDGLVWRGTTGVAGALGHVSVDRAGLRCCCGRRGCLDTIASATAIERRAELELGSLPTAWRAGNARAVAAALEGARALAAALADVVHLLNPSLIVLSGSVAQLGDAWIDEVRRTVASDCFVESGAACRIDVALSGHEAGAVGAALLAAELVTEDRDSDV